MVDAWGNRRGGGGSDSGRACGRRSLKIGPHIVAWTRFPLAGVKLAGADQGKVGVRELQDRVDLVWPTTYAQAALGSYGR